MGSGRLGPRQQCPPLVSALGGLGSQQWGGQVSLGEVKSLLSSPRTASVSARSFNNPKGRDWGGGDRGCLVTHLEHWVFRVSFQGTQRISDCRSALLLFHMPRSQRPPIMLLLRPQSFILRQVISHLSVSKVFSCSRESGCDAVSRARPVGELVPSLSFRAAHTQDGNTAAICPRDRSCLKTGLHVLPRWSTRYIRLAISVTAKS